MINSESSSDNGAGAPAFNDDIVAAERCRKQAGGPDRNLGDSVVAPDLDRMVDRGQKVEARGGIGGVIPVFDEFEVIDAEERAAVDQRILAVVVGGIACPGTVRSMKSMLSIACSI